MSNTFESPEEQEKYKLWALHAISVNEPASRISIHNHLSNSGAFDDYIEGEKLTEAVKQLEYESLVFIDRDDLAYIADIE